MKYNRRLQDRLKKLSDKIDNFKYNHDHRRDKVNTSQFPNLKLVNICVELVAGLVVGLIVGYLLDKMFFTKPIFIIICVIFSFIASFYNIYRLINKRDNNGS